jgi:hypothetical protein
MKYIINSITCFICLIAFSNHLSAQQYEDVIYLKNKSTLHGSIMKYSMADQTLKFKTGNEDTMTFKFGEIDKITKSQLSSRSGVFVGFGTGFALPTGGDAKNYSGSGFTVYDYQGGLFSRYVGMRVDLQFSSFSSKDYPPNKVDANYMSFTPMVDLLGGDFNAKSRLFYYGIFGIGFNVGALPKIKTPVVDPQTNDTTWNESDSKSVTGFVLHLGAGAGYRLFGSVAFTAEFQYNFLGSGGSSLSFIPIRFGFSFMPK